MESFKRSEVWGCYEFAQRMVGCHNPHMIMTRKDWEIFRDDLRGKLGEIAVRKYITENIPGAQFDADIDYSATPRGQWDNMDLVVNGKNISVKSVKGKSRFLMIESERYKADGSSSYKNHDGSTINIDLYVLVRVSIDPEMDYADMKYRNIGEFKASKGGRTIGYEILGWISHEDFWKRKHFAKRGQKCDYKNLIRVCEGKEAEHGDPKDRTGTLQQDNYIIDSSKELLPIKDIIKVL